MIPKILFIFRYPTACLVR